MSLKTSLRSQIERARGISEGMLAAFKTPTQWTHQVHARANHALWFAGHMGTVDNYFISMLDRSRHRAFPEFERLFSMGSQPTNDPAAYPSASDVLAFMRERRATLLAILDRLSEDDLARATPPGSPDIFPDFRAIFETVAWHEGLHSGQVSVAHRALGNEPLMTA